MLTQHLFLPSTQTQLLASVRPISFMLDPSTNAYRYKYSAPGPYRQLNSPAVVLALRLSTTGSGVGVSVSIGNGVDVREGVAGAVSVGIGVNVSGTELAVKISVEEMFVGDDSTSGDEEAGGVPPLKVQARVVNTRSKGSNILFIS